MEKKHCINCHRQLCVTKVPIFENLNEEDLVKIVQKITPAVSVTIFAFAKDEEISTHESQGDAMVTVLEGTGRFTIG